MSHSYSFGNLRLSATASWLPCANLVLIKPVFAMPSNYLHMDIYTQSCAYYCGDSLADHIEFCTDKCYRYSENVQCPSVILFPANPFYGDGLVADLRLNSCMSYHPILFTSTGGYGDSEAWKHHKP